jgi:serine/threonine protein kinase
MSPAILPITSQSLLDRAYEEYCNLADSDKPVPTEEFLGRYPTIQSSLARLLRLHHEVEAVQRGKSREWPSIGTSFRGFDLLAKLGDGAFSRVYLAWESALGNRRVALKLTRRSISEAYTQGRLSHTGIMPLLTAFEDPTTTFGVICMPYLGSATLGNLLDMLLAEPAGIPAPDIVRQAARDAHPKDREALPVSVRDASSYETSLRRIFGEICDALDFLHRQGIVHCDLKPTNVLLKPDGKPVLMDFNLAQDPSNPETHFGGTCLYMSPEQLRRMREQDSSQPVSLGPQSDIYALGVMLWQLLTGDHPFGPFSANMSGAALRAALETRQANGFSAEVPSERGVSRVVVEIVRRCLENDPERRPATAAELALLLVPAPRRVDRRTRSIRYAGIALVALAAVILPMTRWGPMPNAIADAAQTYRDCVSAFESQKFAESCDRLDDFVKASPKDYRGWYLRAASMLSRQPKDEGSLASAYSDARTAHRLHPDNRTQELLAYAAHRNGDLFAAEGNYRLVVDNGYESVAVFNNLGAILVRNTRFREAGPLLTRAIKLDPNCTTAYHNRAYFHLRHAQVPAKALSPEERLDSLQRSYDDYREVLQTSPSDPLVLGMVASVRTRQAALSPSLEKPALESIEAAVDAGFAWETLRVSPQIVELVDRFPEAKKRIVGPDHKVRPAEFDPLVMPVFSVPVD